MMTNMLNAILNWLRGFAAPKLPTIQDEYRPVPISKDFPVALLLKNPRR
jgi:hypothetical protein